MNLTCADGEIKMGDHVYWVCESEIKAMKLLGDLEDYYLADPFTGVGNYGYLTEKQQKNIYIKFENAVKIALSNVCN